MPLSWYKVSNDRYCLGSRELYRTAPRNDPEAVLEGVAMAGFVGILRQLGDLAQIAAEIFHDLHDQVMAASARGHDLTLRVQQLESELPLIEKDFCQKEHCLLYVASNVARVDWRANLKVNHGIVAGRSTPRFIVEYIKRCRGPPNLSMLDKYDAGGEGACLKRYTNPSFGSDSACSTKLQGGTQRVKISPKILEIRPTFQSSENSKPPKAAHTCSKSETDAPDKASDRFLSMFRQLKYRQRQTNGPVFRSMNPQTQNFRKSEDKTYAVHHSELNKSSTDSPESNIQVTDITVGAASVNEEKTCDLERTSSFEAWLSPDARTRERERAEEAPHDTPNVFVSHVTSNGTLAAGTKNAKDNSNITEEVSYKKAVSKRSRYKGGVEFIASRVSNLPRKLFVKKHDPLTNSFRNMAKKLLELKYDAIRDNESYDFEQDSEDYDAKCLEMSQSNIVDETKEERNAMEKAPSDLARHSHDSCERQPAQAAAPIDTVQDSPADGDGLGRNGNSCSLAAASPSFGEELLALARASDVPSSPDALDHQPTDRSVHTMKASDKEAAENSPNTVSSEDVSDLDGVDKSTEYIRKQVISDTVIVSSPSTSEQSDNPCEASPPASMDEDASDSVLNCNPETIPKEIRLPILGTNPVFSSGTSVPDSEQCCLHPETTRLQSNRGPSYDASVCEELQRLHQPMIHQEPNGSSIPNLCSSNTSPEKCGDSTSTPDTRDLLLPSIRSATCMLNEALHEPATVLPGNDCSEGTKDVTIPPLPPIPPMQWLTVKINTGSGIASPNLGTLRPKSPAINRAAKTYSLQPVHSDEVRSELVKREHEDFYRKATKISDMHGTMLPVAEVNQADVQISPGCRSNEERNSNVHEESVFFSAVEQLRRTSPPSVPRPKYSLLEVGSHDRSMLRTAPSLIYPSRKLSGERSILVEQIKDRSFSLKPVLGRSSNVMVGPRNSEVATILQRADEIRQAHADNNDIDIEDSCSDSD